MENLARLKDPKGNVDVALLQGGVVDKATADGLVSLGRMFPEPLWVFYTGDVTLDRLAALKASGVTALNISFAGESREQRVQQCEMLRRLADDLA